MANSPSTHGAAQSISGSDDQPVDGIAGTHAGNQEPAGAHTDAGKNHPSGNDSKHVPQRAETVHPSNRGYNGSVMRGGKAVGVYTGCGSVSRR
jgi:hypothetical protein